MSAAAGAVSADGPDGAGALLGIAGAFWVFAYGSLMWDPCFTAERVLPARLGGYHRALCILSVRNRGTPERPGLVLGLDRGGSCVGLAMRVGERDAAASLAALAARELSTNAYRPRTLPVRLAAGDTVAALAFVARPEHPQYVRGLSVAEQARLVRQGRGSYGSSLDYLREVCRGLAARGIRDGPLFSVLALAEDPATDPATSPAAAR
jgi:cation transport protein ChaC